MAAVPQTATIGSVKFRLPDWLLPQERYQRRYIPVDPEGGVASDQPGLHPDSKIRLWVIRSWDGGEGEQIWDREVAGYRAASGVTPLQRGDGLVLTRLAETTVDAGGTFADGSRFGLGLGSLWSLSTANGNPWNRTTELWDTDVGTGAGASAATSLTDGDDTFMYSGHASGAIWRWKTGSNAEHYAAAAADPFTYAPVLRSWGGRLFALDGDDLYEIDKTVADTRTIRESPSGSSAVYLAVTPWSYNRMSLSDKGPIWLQRLDNGQTLIHEYNVSLDTASVIGKLPVDFAYPYSIFFTQGFVFVGFRYANAHTETGPAHLAFIRGAQRGSTDQFTSPTGVSASKPVLIGGQIGDQLVCYFDGVIWGYDFSTGGINQIALKVLTGEPQDMITFGQDIFLGPVNTNNVERYLADEYVASGTLDTGRFDFDYPGLLKLLTDVGVVTDPLPALTSVSVGVAVDGGSVTALAGAHDTDTARRYAWAGSAPSSDITGYEFEIRLTLATTGSTATPTVRQIWAAVTGVAHRVEWVVAVDCTRFSDLDIDNLNGLLGGTYTFTDPFQNKDSDGADTFVVTVEEVITPEMMSQLAKEHVYATVRLRSRDLVGVLGSS